MITIKISHPQLHAMIFSPLSPSTFHLLLIVTSLVPLQHQRASANAVTTPLPHQRATANAPSTPPCQHTHPNANLQNPRWRAANDAPTSTRHRQHPNIATNSPTNALPPTPRQRGWVQVKQHKHSKRWCVMLLEVLWYLFRNFAYFKRPGYAQS